MELDPLDEKSPVPVSHGRSKRSNVGDILIYFSTGDFYEYSVDSEFQLPSPSFEQRIYINEHIDVLSFKSRTFPV